MVQVSVNSHLTFLKINYGSVFSFNLYLPVHHKAHTSLPHTFWIVREDWDTQDKTHIGPSNSSPKDPWSDWDSNWSTPHYALCQQHTLRYRLQIDKRQQGIGKKR